MTSSDIGTLTVSATEHAFNELLSAESLSGCAFILNHNNALPLQFQVILCRRIVQYGGSIVQALSEAAFVIVPNLLLSVPVGRLLLLHDLMEVLDRLDSCEMPWHIARGLPLEFQKGDCIVMSGKNMEGMNYWQEWHKFDWDREGKLKVHRIRMDAPKGSGVILTDDQYLTSLQKYGEHKKQHKSRSRQRHINLCLMCNEVYKSYNDHVKLLKHKESMQQVEPAYSEVDLLFDELKLKKKETITRSKLKWKIPEPEAVDQSHEKSQEKSESSTMTPFKRKLAEISGSFGVTRRLRVNYRRKNKKAKIEKHRTFPKV